MPPCLVLAALVCLQDQSTPETLVTAPRFEGTETRASVTVITAEQIERTGARSLPKVLEMAAGVWVQETNLGGGSPHVRGLVGNQVLIMVDGVRLNDSTTRLGPNQSLNTIDPEIVERIEIIRGPGSVLYGSDAIGGVIAIWTRRTLPGTNRGLHGEAEAKYLGEVDGYRGTVGLSHGGEDNGWFGIGSYADYDDLRTADGTVPFTGYETGHLFGSWDTVLSEHDDLRVTARIHRDEDVPRTDRLVPGFGQTEPTDDRHHFVVQEREGYMVAWTNDEQGGFADRMQVRLSARRYDEQLERIPLGSTTQRNFQDIIETVGLGGDWKKQASEDHLLTWGFDLDHDDVESTRKDVDLTNGSASSATGNFQPGSQYDSFGAFVQDEIASFDPIDITAGLRWSYYEFEMEPSSGVVEGDFDALTASLAAASDLTQDTRLTASLAQGFRAPNLSDLGRDADFAGGTELANPDLEPEESWTAELVLEKMQESWSAFGTIFFTDLDEVVGRVLIDEGDPNTLGDETYQRENIGTAEIYGIEAGARTRLGAAGSPWSLRANAAWTEGRQEGELDPETGAPLDEVPFRRIPPLHGVVGLGWEPEQAVRDFLGWSELTVQAAAEQDDLHPQDELDPRFDPEGTDGWVTVDLDAGGPLGSKKSGATWMAGLHNIFDEAYRIHGSGIDGPGFAVVFGLRIRR